MKEGKKGAETGKGEVSGGKAGRGVNFHRNMNGWVWGWRCYMSKGRELRGCLEDVNKDHVKGLRSESVEATRVGEYFLEGGEETGEVKRGGKQMKRGQRVGEFDA